MERIGAAAGEGRCAIHTQAACHAIAAGTQARIVKIPNTARPCCAAAVFSFDTVA